MAENRFDNEAHKWDERPTAVEIATKSSKALLDNIPFSKDMNVMDFGCGMRRGEIVREQERIECRDERRAAGDCERDNGKERVIRVGVGEGR